MEGFCLTEERLARERARGLWPGRVATDYVDRWAEEKPEATALAAWRTEEETETRLTWRQLARQPEQPRAFLRGLEHRVQLARPRGDLPRGTERFFGGANLGLHPGMPPVETVLFYTGGRARRARERQQTRQAGARRPPTSAGARRSVPA